MKQEEQEKPIIDINFNEIKAWIQGHLIRPNSLISCNNQERKIVINTLTGTKTVEIPVKQSNEDTVWAEAWVKVYHLCLASLEEKLEYLCLNDSLVKITKENKVRVGKETIELPDNTDDIDYINTLEKIINIYDKLKEEEKASPVRVYHSTLKIDKPDKEEVIEVDQANEPLPEVSIETKEKVKPKKQTKKTIIGQKLSDDEVINEMDCSRFRENEEPFVLITCADLNKGEGIFTDNADLCKEEGIAIGAFIRGKATTKDQGKKEAERILKLIDNYDIEGPIIYELNNEEVNDDKTMSNKVLSIIDMCDEMGDMFSSNNYCPIICMDTKSAKKIDAANMDLRPDYTQKHPRILRILPREKEDTSEIESTILMDPIHDYDIVTIKDPEFGVKSR